MVNDLSRAWLIFEKEGGVHLNEVSKEQLLAEVQKMKRTGSRFLTITCVDDIEQFELIYSFDHNLDLVNYKVKAEKGTGFPSISNIYSCAFLVENEIKDQFGLDFTDLILDFEGFLILSREGPVTPMLRQTKKREKNEDAV